MVSTAGGIAIAIVVVLAAAAAGWVVFTQLRAHRLGLPRPSLSSYLPWRQRDKPYGPPRPAPGGVVGWINDQVRRFRNRGSRSAGGAYEQALHGRRGFGPLDPDEAWDARVGHEADGYGYGGYGYEEQELGGGGLGGGGLGGRRGSEPDHDDEAARGRAPTRAANPFDDDAAADASLRGVSPRPIDTAAAAAAATRKPKPRGEAEGGGSNSPTERRSVFRENVS